MYTPLFKKTFIAIDYDDETKATFLAYCREHFRSNLSELTIVNGFANTYQSSKVIWWYTHECFVFRMLNRSLRCMEADIMVDMSFFIRDLHQRIDQLHRVQLPGYHGKPFTVYRGQGLSNNDFQRMRQSQGDLISFNSFLSTSTDLSVTDTFTAMSMGKTDTVTVLYDITIDSSVTSTPYANIKEDSAMQDKNEILFSMHSVFRIEPIDSVPNNSETYRVKLQLTSDNDQQLRCLTDRFEEEIKNSDGWFRVGLLLIKVNELGKAMEVFTNLLDQATDNMYIAAYQSQIGLAYYKIGEYPKPLSFYERALAIWQTALPANHPDLAISYNNIGSIYHKMKEYTKALLFFERALKIFKLAFGNGHPQTKSVIINIAFAMQNL
jgi:hypothetical protein